MKMSITPLALLSLTLLAAGSLSSAATVKTVKIEMSDFKLAPTNLTLKAGQPVIIQLSNVGMVEHEFQAYSKPSVAPTGEATWDPYMKKNTIWLTSKDVKLTVNGKASKGSFYEVPLKPGDKATLSFTPSKAGAFEMACHAPGHYEMGMRAPLTVQ